jgi:hypothetical protein
VSLCVLFRKGSVSARELLASLESYFPLVFAIGNDAYARGFASLLATAGTVVELTGDVTADAMRLTTAQVSGIVTFSESGVRSCAELADRLGLPGHDLATARALTDKHAQRGLMEAAGAGGVASRLIMGIPDWNTAVREIGLPLVLKPRCGEGSRNTHLVRDADDGQALVARLLDRSIDGHEEDLVAEQYLVGVPMDPYGDYVSVESVCVGGEIRHIGVTGKFPLVPPFRETGQFYPAALSPDLHGQVGELAGKALRALGVRHGVTHTEIKLTAKGPRIIEVNGRLGGYVADLYQRALGFDLVQVAADLALGRPGYLEAKPGSLTCFQYISRPPIGANRLVAVSGRQVLVGHQNVDAYQQYVRPGSALASDMSSSYLDRLSGSARSSEEMMRAIDECLALLTYEFDTPDGSLSIDGATLRSINSREAGA